MSYLLLLLLSGALVANQTWTQAPKVTSAPKPAVPATAPAAKVYTYVEEMPQPPGGGGNAAIVAAIQKGIRIPSLHGNYPESSRLVVAFTVTEAGKV